MRVLIVNNHARVTGGVDRHCLDLARALRAVGDEVRFLSTRHPDNEEVEGEFVRLTTDRDKRGETRGLAAGLVAATAIWNVEVARASSRLIRQFQPDVVHAHRVYPQLSVAPIFVARHLGVPVVQTAQDYEFVAANARAEHGFLDRGESELRYRALNSTLFAVRRAIHVPRVDEWIVPADYVARRYAASGIFAATLPNFYPRSEASPAPFEARDGIAFVGRLQEEKGVRHVVELARAVGVPVRVAGNGDLREELQAAAQLLPNLEYLGTLSQSGVLQLLGQSRICVIPSLWGEPGALTSLEAMTVGTPIVGYRVGGLGDYIGSSRSGVAIAPTAIGLVEECTRLHDDRARWLEFSQNGQRAIAGRHSVDAYVRAVRKIYAKSSEPKTHA